MHRNIAHYFDYVAILVTSLSQVVSIGCLGENGNNIFVPPPPLPPRLTLAKLKRDPIKNTH